MSHSTFLTDGPISVAGTIQTPWWALTPHSYLLSAFLNGLATALTFKWIESLSAAVRRSNRSVVLETDRVVSGVLPELLTNFYEFAKVLLQRPIVGIGNSPVVWNRVAFSRLGKAFIVVGLTLGLEGGANVLSQPSLGGLKAQQFGCIVFERDPLRFISEGVMAIRGSFSRQITVNLPASVAQYTSLPTFSYERTNLTEFLNKSPAQALNITCTTKGGDDNRIRCRIEMLGQLFQYKIRIDLSTVGGSDRFFVPTGKTRLGKADATAIEQQLNTFSEPYRLNTPVYSYDGNGFSMQASAKPLAYRYSDVWPGDMYMTQLVETLIIRVERKPKCDYVKRVPGGRELSTGELDGVLGQRQYSIVPVFPLLMFLFLGQVIAALIQWAVGASYHEAATICALERLNALGDSSILHAEGGVSLELRGYIFREERLAHVGYSRPDHFPEDLTEEVAFEDMRAKLSDYDMELRFR
jgi:hypothetical protein